MNGKFFRLAGLRGKAIPGGAAEQPAGNDMKTTRRGGSAGSTFDEFGDPRCFGQAW